MSQNEKILAIVGPTASGKSALAVALSSLLSGEVVSCDSMQVYRRMDVGTAKPTREEMGGIPHHLLDVVEPTTDFSVADYIREADAAVDTVVARGNLPVLSGGTGLYLDAFLRGMPETPGGDLLLRARLQEEAEREGAEALYARLLAVDPESAATTHQNNLRRVIRALEIYESTGVPKSEWDRRSREKPPRYRALVLGLAFEDRDLLYARIEARVDAMMAAGLAEETAALEKEGVFAVNGTAAGAIGYKEILPFVRGECTRAEAVEALKTATRRYAKRQMTWFFAKPYVTWICADGDGKMRKNKEIVNNALSLYREWNSML